MSRIGYARVSTIDQNLDRQLELLSNCDKIFTDKVLTNGDNINNIYTIRGTEINSAFLKTKG